MILSGRVSSNAVHLRAAEVAQASAPKLTIINMLQLPGGGGSQQVLLQVRFAEVNRRACEMLRIVFAAYVEEPERLGDAAVRRIEREGLHRTVCDYIAGMTDRFLLEEHARLVKPRR